MSLFRPFDPNPFCVNAFTIAEVPIEELNPSEIGELCEARRERIDGPDAAVETIPGGGDSRYTITASDLTRAEEVLRDPSRRIAEELLMPSDYRPQALPGVAEFVRKHALTPASTRQLLRADPLNATSLLIRELPAIERGRLLSGSPSAQVPSLVPIKIPVAALLPPKRVRRV